jgi:hypothetical protein
VVGVWGGRKKRFAPVELDALLGQGDDAFDAVGEHGHINWGIELAVLPIGVGAMSEEKPYDTDVPVKGSQVERSVSERVARVQTRIPVFALQDFSDQVFVTPAGAKSAT